MRTACEKTTPLFFFLARCSPLYLERYPADNERNPGGGYRSLPSSPPPSLWLPPTPPPRPSPPSPPPPPPPPPLPWPSTEALLVRRAGTSPLASRRFFLWRFDCCWSFCCRCLSTPPCLESRNRRIPAATESGVGDAAAPSRGCSGGGARCGSRRREMRTSRQAAR